ncbi:DMT family transporter [Alcanivorax quisquiliarum]|uniref:Multidrug efflux SMR transporter n=1 Tax=Alcanivorax quisquiliarum TaxID=2933565 RepID=A0ABT0E4G6_9GAMM|nr:multidrug efflux SMR transporter [Alcanivorax quisquiliarum]MCK0536658.1 multidrug efflux SMR transporter [Alcanivorax quisquiliarum]
MPAYALLGIAIIAEVIATSALKASSGFTRLGPSLVVITGYACAFYFLALVMRSIPVGVAYAIWSGVGIVLIGGASAVLYQQMPDWPALLGMALIVIGVAVINLFSRMTVH